MSYAQTDWRALCEELISLVERCPVTWPEEDPEQDLLDRISALSAQPEPEGVGPTDEELLSLDQLREAWNAQADAANSWDELGIDEIIWWTQRQALARWGRPAPAPDGEPPVDLIIAAYRSGVDDARIMADAERQAAPVPVASDVYFEFVVSDADCCTQAGGIAPTYAQALSEGQHYLAQYQQDGPHTLEVRRVEVLHPDALPLPSGEPQP